MALMWSLMVFMRANDESETKAKRLRASWMNKRAKASAEGRRMTTVCPGWLRAEGDGFAIIPNRAEIVRRIFAETLAGRGQHAIAQTLTTEGVTTWRRGKVWHRTFVRKLLVNPAVIGTASLGETERLAGGGQRRAIVGTVEGYYPPVIEQETWDRTRALLGDRERPQSGAADKAVRFLLGKLARCPLCDATMTRVYKGRKGGLPYLVCTTAKAKGRCVATHVRVENVEAAVFERFSELMLGKPARDGTDEGELMDRLRNLEGWEAATIEELEDLRAARKARTISRAQRDREAELYGHFREIEERRDAIEKELANASSPVVEARLGRLIELLARGPQDDLREANAALREAFTSVVVDYRDGTLGFRWRHGGETWLHYDLAKVFAEHDAA
jgi:hypothetical protein